MHPVHHDWRFWALYRYPRLLDPVFHGYLGGPIVTWTLKIRILTMRLRSSNWIASFLLSANPDFIVLWHRGPTVSSSTSGICATLCSSGITIDSSLVVSFGFKIFPDDTPLRRHRLCIWEILMGNCSGLCDFYPLKNCVGARTSVLSWIGIAASMSALCWPSRFRPACPCL